MNATSDRPVEAAHRASCARGGAEPPHEEVPHAVAVTGRASITPATKKHAAASRRAALRPESQKGILVGKNGAMIRQIGADARPGIERLLGAKVMLELTVRVRRGWRDDDRVLDQLG